MKTTLLAFLFGGMLAAAGFGYLKTRAHGFSTREQPTSLERLVAASARSLALPRGARERQNPVPVSDEIISEGMAHWADHCASCHANDGSGQTTLGRQLYPPSPDMRKDDTQKKTDGELFYIIENGIRLSGMPGWSSGHARGEADSWKLVDFIRHLPSLSRDEVKKMEGLNPKSPEDLEEERAEEDFLKGSSSNEPAAPHHHH
jgi:mono/diheme cytochrome c family protein